MTTFNDRATAALDAGVSAVYSGRPGCACGCRGTHSSKPGQITRVTNILRRAIADNTTEGPGDITIGPGFVSLDTDRRTFVAYTATGAPHNPTNGKHPAS